MCDQLKDDEMVLIVFLVFFLTYGIKCRRVRMSAAGNSIGVPALTSSAAPIGNGIGSPRKKCRRVRIGISAGGDGVRIGCGGGGDGVGIGDGVLGISAGGDGIRGGSTMICHHCVSTIDDFRWLAK